VLFRSPIEADIIVLDEVSMVDILLMRSFLQAVKPQTAIVLVGDNNQLPSVGAGNVLADIITSGTIPHVHLTTIFRQAASSRIVTAAHEIINGDKPFFTNSKSDNCFFLTETDPQRCLESIIDLVSRRLPASYKLDPINDIQVLSPMHKGALGTQNVNRELQKKLNLSNRKIEYGQTAFYEGDKVMQIRNNYDLGVFNGDIGVIEKIIEDTGLCVNYDGTIVHYDLKELDELLPAYCISIHKSQGSEFKAVVIILSTQHYIMLQRNLIYTAITRARQLCILAGSQKALEISIKNNQALNRYSRLHARLDSVIKGNNPQTASIH
jgi:exodeoxyribonuclease V alpha subunit